MGVSARRPAWPAVKTARKLEPLTKKSEPKPANHRARWSLGDDLELSLHFGRGVSASELAKLMKRTKYAVIGRLHTLGLLSFNKDTMTYYTKPQYYYKIKKAVV